MPRETAPKQIPDYYRKDVIILELKKLCLRPNELILEVLDDGLRCVPVNASPVGNDSEVPAQHDGWERRPIFNKSLVAKGP